MSAKLIFQQELAGALREAGWVSGDQRVLRSLHVRAFRRAVRRARAGSRRRPGV